MVEQKNGLSQKMFGEYDVRSKFTTGGSSAGTYLVADSNGKEQVLKFSTWRGIGASGTPWLRAQAARLQELKEELPEEGATSIPEVYKVHDDGEVFYYTSEYLNGTPFSISSYNDPNFDSGEFALGVSKILDLVTNNFFNQGKLDVPEGYIESVHTKRAKSRLKLLTDTESEVYAKFVEGRSIDLDDDQYHDMHGFFERLIGFEEIVINGNKFKNPVNILRDLDEEQLKKLTPTFIPKFAHGDGTLRNFMITSAGHIKVIDVRGVDLPSDTVSRVCIPYELGKMMRTIFLEIVRANDFYISLDKTESNDDSYFEFNLKENTNALKFARSRKDILSTFAKHKELSDLMVNEGDWIKKTLFAEAIHFLADAVNRLESDNSGKQTLAYFLIGTALLSECLDEYSQLKDDEIFT